MSGKGREGGCGARDDLPRVGDSRSVDLCAKNPAGRPPGFDIIDRKKEKRNLAILRSRVTIVIVAIVGSERPMAGRNVTVAVLGLWKLSTKKASSKCVCVFV